MRLEWFWLFYEASSDFCNDLILTAKIFWNMNIHIRYNINNNLQAQTEYFLLQSALKNDGNYKVFEFIQKGNSRLFVHESQDFSVEKSFKILAINLFKWCFVILLFYTIQSARWKNIDKALITKHHRWYFLCTHDCSFL